MDCYVIPYNQILLTAFQTRTEFRPLYKVNDWWSFEEKFEEELPDFTNTPIKDLLINHRVAPLSQLYGLSDPKRINDINAVPSQYISTYEKMKSKFKKVTISTETSFQFEGSQFFEMVSNNVLRHQGRLNGDKVLLVESCLW